MGNIYLALVLSLVSFFAAGQGTIISVIPNNGHQGQKLNVTIKGMNTHFRQGVTEIKMGQGIDIHRINVSNPEMLTASVEIRSQAQTGMRTVSVITGNNRVSYDNGFEVFQLGSNVRTSIQVYPTDILYLSDFDVTNKQGLPQLFNITVFNDQAERQLTLRLLVIKDGSRELVEAAKDLGKVAPGAVLNINNRQLEDYNLRSAGNEVLKKSTETGILPAGEYIYRVFIEDQNGKKFAEDEGVNVTTNQITSLEMISPGNPVGESPEVIYSLYPLFQWLSNNTEFDFKLYEVRAGQQGAEDIATNLPVFQKENITTQSLLYPNSAEQLKDGKTYAWQITAYFRNTKGKQGVKSEMFWFALQSTSPEKQTISNVEVIPDVISLKTSQTHQFKATGYNKDGQAFEIDCTWDVIPEEAGNINRDGLFEAGNKPTSAAVVAKYQGITQHATVMIEWDENLQDQYLFQGFLDTVFGLPTQEK